MEEGLPAPPEEDGYADASVAGAVLATVFFPFIALTLIGPLPGEAQAQEQEDEEDEVVDAPVPALG